MVVAYALKSGEVKIVFEFDGLEDTGRGKGKLGRSESGMDLYIPNVK